MDWDRIKNYLKNLNWIFCNFLFITFNPCKLKNHHISFLIISVPFIEGESPIGVLSEITFYPDKKCAVCANALQTPGKIQFNSIQFNPRSIVALFTMKISVNFTFILEVIQFVTLPSWSTKQLWWLHMKLLLWLNDTW